MSRLIALTLSVLLCVTCLAAARQQKPPAAPPPPESKTTPVTPSPNVPASPTVAQSALPGDYVIGPDDALAVLFWRDKDMSAEATVRPDGKISLPLLNDVYAAGLTPDQLRDRVNELAKRYVESPNATIVIRQINSRKVFITGQVAKPGSYPLNDRMTVVQLIALAGGLTEFANSKDIVIMRADSGGAVRPSGEPVSFPFNYKEVAARRNLKQNIDLKPGDTVIVP